MFLSCLFVFAFLLILQSSFKLPSCSRLEVLTIVWRLELFSLTTYSLQCFSKLNENNKINCNYLLLFVSNLSLSVTLNHQQPTQKYSWMPILAARNIEPVVHRNVHVCLKRLVWQWQACFTCNHSCSISMAFVYKTGDVESETAFMPWGQSRPTIYMSLVQTHEATATSWLLTLYGRHILSNNRFLATLFFPKDHLKTDMWQVCAQAGCLEMVVRRFSVTRGENNIVMDYFRRSGTPESWSR